MLYACELPSHCPKYYGLHRVFACFLNWRAAVRADALHDEAIEAILKGRG
jgi:hypothetical protein